MEFLLYLSLVPAIGVLAQWLAWRLNLPGILLLLLFGMILGQFLQPDDYLAKLTGGDETAGPNLLFPLVALSVAVIMFEGGLSLKLHELKEAGAAVLQLCTIGAAITFALAATAARWTLGFDWSICFLLGGILTVTGPTVIGPLLRQVQPSRRVSSTLKWEGIVIDPIGAVLAVLVFEQLIDQLHQGGAASAALMLLKTVAVGSVLGILGGLLLAIALRRFWIPDNLHGVAALSLGMLLFALSDMLAHESGLITVTVMGVWLANQKNLDIEHIVELKENLRTLLIGCLFVVLGSRVQLSDIMAIGWGGIAFVALLIVIVRPISVFASTLGTKLTLPEKTFVAFLAPRGIVAAAVSSVFALAIERDGQPLNLVGSDQLSTVTFFVIVATVLIYGLSASPLAKLLGLAEDQSNGILIAGADPWVRDFALTLQKEDVAVLLVDTNFNKVSAARQLGINAVCANILNEHVREDLDLTGIGQLMALTQNDEVNSLATRECRHLFNRSALYQLPFKNQNAKSRRGLTSNLMGRALFSPERTFSNIRDMHAAGAVFKATKLSETFTFADFETTYGDSATILCSIDTNRKLLVNTIDAPLKPEAGQTVIALVGSINVPDEHAATPAE
ncbi:cation:proton antiporter [Stieleria varia]|uniref:K(+)/H(+) antiporter NhaP2 n=1 Tax=Stieleria varia TaxID=2528005 RepID=A0A5C6AMW0_9BACT|nr:sodium:proton antiporter [Stieleria varia]TWU00817.1 K(+)/H(+) antiporter NhaP2 [Stieleria varia]